MKISRIEIYNSQLKHNYQDNRRKQNVCFTSHGNFSYNPKKGCGFLMALSLATVIGTLSAPFATYNYLSENSKENGKIVNILTSIGSGIAAFGLGSAAIFCTSNKFNPSKNDKNVK